MPGLSCAIETARLIVGLLGRRPVSNPLSLLLRFPILRFVSAVERAGLRSLNEGQSIEYEIERNRGRESAANLRVK